MPASYTSFFYTGEGKLHSLRIAGILYIIGFIPSWSSSLPMDWMRALFTLGWWIGFCRKQPADTLAKMVRDPFTISGLVLMVAGLMGQAYMLRQAAILAQ